VLEQAAGKDEDIEVRPQELTMAGSLIETLAGEFDPSQYTDRYREALEALIDAKVEGREVVAPTAAAPTSGTVVDLMAALRASVEAARSGRTGTEATAPEAAKPVKRATAKAAAKPPDKAAAKAPARKTAAKPSAAKAAVADPAKKAVAKKAARKSA